MNKLTEKEGRQRKFLMMLPLITLPFLCLAFWALGGGIGTETAIESRSGLNMDLPEPSLEAGYLDKMGSYEQAEMKDNLLRDQLRMDPFVNTVPETKDTLLSGLKADGSLGKTELAMQEKLDELQRLIEQPEIPDRAEGKGYNSLGLPGGVETHDPELKRLESMMATVIAPEIEDPEMERIDNLLDKLLDVQHPQRVQERMAHKNGDQDPVFSVEVDSGDANRDWDEVSSYGKTESNRFHSLGKPSAKTISSVRPAVAVQVTRDQEVVSGASIELELSQPVFIEGVEFEKGSKLTGVCTLVGERLQIEVQRIRKDRLIIPVNLYAVDMDALPGIRIPDSITRDAIKQGAGDGIQSMNMMSLSSSWEAQASMAGMETVKGILSKKAKLVRVRVKAGHPLLLVDSSGS